nr:unnamed protein product [Callosobruchus chinensis]
METLNNPTSSQQTYSNALLQESAIKPPSKRQAIILTSIEGLKIRDYLIAVGSIIQPKNILLASRISNTRVCIYLKSSNLVDSFVQDYKTMNIQDHAIEVRRMITPAVTLVISNICPSVPNNVVEDLLKINGIKLLSRITHLRVGMQEAEYSHVLSFRLVVYIAPSEVIIPHTTTLSFEGTTYRIFLSTDSINCSCCQQPGHTQMQCPNKALPSEENTSTNREYQSTPTAQPTEMLETPSAQSSDQNDQVTPKTTTENSNQLPTPTPTDQQTSTS